MKHKFRAGSIHLEVELLANEFDKALPPQKNDRAEYLFWYMENYPNAELWRALPLVEKNFLDMPNENPVRRKCAKMLGEIGAAGRTRAVMKKVMELLLVGIGSSNAHLSYECMKATERMASKHRWQEFDFAVGPLFERVIGEKYPHGNPNLIDGALDALVQIKPNKPEALELAKDAKGELIAKKGKNRNSPWERHIRRVEFLKREWETLLMGRGVIAGDGKKGAFEHGPRGNGPHAANNWAAPAKKRRIIP